MKLLVPSLVFAAGLAAGVPFVFSSGIPAATPPARGARALANHPFRAFMVRRMVVRRVARKLDLTADQLGKIKAVRAQDAASIRAVRSDASLTREQKRAQVLAILQGARTQVRGILTADQQAKLSAIRNRFRHLRGLPAI
jgi:hypothetical protein